MGVRNSENIIQQIGIQSLYGTPVAATRKFAGLFFTFSDKFDVKTYRSKGAKFNDSSVINKSWSEFTFEGPGSYNELPYILAGLFPGAVPTTVVAGVFKYAFNPAGEGKDDHSYFTIEEGDSDDADRFSDVTIKSFNLDFSRDEVNYSGDGFAKPNDGSFSALTSSGVSKLASRPISGNEVSVYMDSTFAGIGTTKLTDAFTARFSMGEKRQPKWVLNAAETSWKEDKEVVPDVNLTIATEDNAQSRALRASLASNPVQFFRVEAIGPVISGVNNYRLRLDFCGKIMNPNREPDMDGIYGFEYEFGAFLENTMNRGFSFEIINALSSL